MVSRTDDPSLKSGNNLTSRYSCGCYKIGGAVCTTLNRQSNVKVSSPHLELVQIYNLEVRSWNKQNQPRDSNTCRLTWTPKQAAANDNQYGH